MYTKSNRIVDLCVIVDNNNNTGQLTNDETNFETQRPCTLIKNVFAKTVHIVGRAYSRAEVRRRLSAGVPLALEYTHVRHAERGVAQRIAHRVDGAVDVA